MFLILGSECSISQKYIYIYFFFGKDTRNFSRVDFFFCSFLELGLKKSGPDDP